MCESRVRWAAWKNCAKLATLSYLLCSRDKKSDASAGFGVSAAAQRCTPRILLESGWCPWPAIAYYHNQLNLKQFSSPIAANTNRNTNKMTLGISSQK